MNNKWIKLLNRKSSFAFSIALIYSNQYILKRKLGISINNFWEDSVTNNICYVREELQSLGESINKTIIDDSSFIQKNIYDCKKSGDNLLTISKNLSKYDYSNLSNKEIADYLSSFNKCYQEFMYFVIFPHAIETFINLALESALAEYCSKKEAESIIQIFLIPRKLDTEQQIELFKSVSVVKKHADRLIEQGNRLETKYGWIPMWSLTAKPLDSSYYQNQILSLLENDFDYKKLITDVKKEQIQNDELFNNALERIKRDKLIGRYVDLIQEYVHLRIYRKNIFSYSHYLLLPLLKEIGKRIGDGDIVYYMSNEELIQALKNKLDSLSRFSKRQNGYAVFLENQNLKILTGKNNILNKLYDLVPEIEDEKSLSELKELRGTIASKGKTTGRIVVVNSIADINKVKRGEILVTPMTTPDYTAVISKVKAIITNEGGVTCHAAIIAREFKIPCIIATKIATYVFKDGDIVEVDADKGVCKKII